MRTGGCCLAVIGGEDEKSGRGGEGREGGREGGREVKGKRMRGRVEGVGKQLGEEGRGMEDRERTV